MEQDQVVQKIMSEIHRLVQKLKEGGMTVDSSVDTKTTVIDETVKYTDSLTITGNFERVRFDTRSLEEIRAEAEKVKAEIQAQADIRIARADEVLGKIREKQDRK